MLLEIERPNMFATAACLRLPAKGDATYALAGHLPLLHFRASTGVVDRLTNGQLALGILAGQTYSESAVTLSVTIRPYCSSASAVEPNGPSGLVASRSRTRVRASSHPRSQRLLAFASLPSQIGHIRVIDLCQRRALAGTRDEIQETDLQEFAHGCGQNFRRATT